MKEEEGERGREREGEKLVGSRLTVRSAHQECNMTQRKCLCEDPKQRALGLKSSRDCLHLQRPSWL